MEDSLFTYSRGTNFSTFFGPTFVPAFSLTFATPELALQARTNCGGDPFCLFDVAATNSIDIGLSTLQGNLMYETIVNISVPGKKLASNRYIANTAHTLAVYTCAI